MDAQSAARERRQNQFPELRGLTNNRGIPPPLPPAVHLQPSMCTCSLGRRSRMIFSLGNNTTTQHITKRNYTEFSGTNRSRNGHQKKGEEISQVYSVFILVRRKMEDAIHPPAERRRKMQYTHLQTEDGVCNAHICRKMEDAIHPLAERRWRRQSTHQLCMAHHHLI